jgi:acyl dehydratase
MEVMMTGVQESEETLDTSDVDKYIGQMVGGGQLKEPISVTDIRRWVQAMNYPNPRHFDEAAAQQSLFGEIVAPQSFAACGDAHGMTPAIVGKIPGQHVIFGGGEWWFYGPRIRPGDTIRAQRRFDGYRVTETKFAGPTMFSRGDTLYVNQRMEPVGKLRSTAVRYRPDIARKRGFYEQTAPVPAFTADQLKEVERQRLDWIRSGATGEGPGEVKVGDVLPTRPMGPHTQTSFSTEYRAWITSVWGTQYQDGDFLAREAGWLPDLLVPEGDGSDQAMRFGLNYGPASGHTNIDKAKLVGLPRHYGYGSSMGVWVLDYVAYWVGDGGFVRHSKIDYRFPVFEGDVSYLNAEVDDVRFDPLLGVQLASLRVRMTNQDETVIARGHVEVELARI